MGTRHLGNIHEDANQYSEMEHVSMRYSKTLPHGTNVNNIQQGIPIWDIYQ